jgi:hypothetical protein
MAALVHIGIGFAAKRAAPSVPVGLLVLSAAATDLIWYGFSFFGIEGYDSIPYFSHGLVMSLAWSTAGALLTAAITRKLGPSLVVGFLVLSHWVVDFITHPMGAISGKSYPPDIPLAFQGSPILGLGLYDHAVLLVWIIEIGSLLAGLASYIVYAIAKRRARKSADGAGA